MNLYILLKQNPTMELELGFPVRDRANGGLIFSYLPRFMVDGKALPLTFL